MYDRACCFRGFGSFIPSPPWAWIQHVPQMTVRLLPGGVSGLKFWIQGWEFWVLGFLKSMVKSWIIWMVGRRVDGTISALTKEMHDHFRYKEF